METKPAIDQLRPYSAAVEGSLLIWPIIGVLAAAFFASFHYDSNALKGAAIALYVVGVFAAVGWQAKKAGVQPRFGTMPKALRNNMFFFWAAVTVVVALSITVALATNFLVAGILVGVAMTVSGLAYHLRSRSIMQELLAAA